MHMPSTYEIPNNLYYTHNHEWARIIDNKIATVGITFYAQDCMRGILSIETAQVGKRVKRNESIATIETAKTVLDVFSPLNGEILDVNEDLVNKPILLGEDPYGQGWLAKLRIDDIKEVKELMNSKQYQRYVEQVPESVSSTQRFY